MELPREQQKFSKVTDAIREVRKDELSPGIRSYLENIEAQMQEIVEKVGAKDEKDIINRGRTGELFISTDDLRRLTSLAQEKVHITETGKRPGFAEKLEEITNETKTYQGPITPEVIAKLPKSIEHIFTPEGKDLIVKLEIGGRDEKELEELLKREGHKITSIAQSMMENDDFKRSLREEDPKQPDWKKWKLKSPEEAKLIRLSVKDLGFPNGATTDQIFARAEELGLELCPPEVGPRFRLQYVNQPMNGYVYVGMKQITDQDGNPRVFNVERLEGGSWLYHSWAEPDREWGSYYEFMFRLRKSET